MDIPAVGEEQLLANQTIQVDVWDRDPFNQKDFMGSLELDTRAVVRRCTLAGCAVEERLELCETPTGALVLEFEFLSVAMDSGGVGGDGAAAAAAGAGGVGGDGVAPGAVAGPDGGGGGGGARGVTLDDESSLDGSDDDDEDGVGGGGRLLRGFGGGGGGFSFHNRLSQNSTAKWLANNLTWKSSRLGTGMNSGGGFGLGGGFGSPTAATSTGTRHSVDGGLEPAGAYDADADARDAGPSSPRMSTTTTTTTTTTMKGRRVGSFQRKGSLQRQGSGVGGGGGGGGGTSFKRSGSRGGSRSGSGVESGGDSTGENKAGSSTSSPEIRMFFLFVRMV